MEISLVDAGTEFPEPLPPRPRPQMLRPEREGAALRGPSLVDAASRPLEERTLGLVHFQDEVTVVLRRVRPSEGRDVHLEVLREPLRVARLEVNVPVVAVPRAALPTVG